MHIKNPCVAKINLPNSYYQIIVPLFGINNSSNGKIFDPLTPGYVTFQIEARLFIKYNGHLNFSQAFTLFFPTFPPKRLAFFSKVF